MKTSTMILIGAAAAGGLYLVSQKLNPPAQPRSAVESIVDGAKSIVGMLTGGSKDPTNQQAGSTGQTWGELLTGWLPGMDHTKTPPSVPNAFGGGSTGTGLAYGTATGSRLVGDGDAAIADALGQDRANRNQSMPVDAFTSEDRMIGGGINYSHYGLPPIFNLRS